MCGYLRNLVILSIFLISSTSVLFAETDTTQVVQPRIVYVNEKSAVTAGVLGGFAGFGLGNFYAENYQLGTICLVSEVLGLGLAIGGWFAADDDNDGFLERSEIKWDNLTGNEAGLFYGGLGIMLASRIFGAVTGAHEATKYNENLNKKFRYESRLEPRIDVSPKGSFIGLAYNF